MLVEWVTEETRKQRCCRALLAALVLLRLVTWLQYSMALLRDTPAGMHPPRPAPVSKSSLAPLAPHGLEAQPLLLQSVRVLIRGIPEGGPLGSDC